MLIRYANRAAMPTTGQTTVYTAGDDGTYQSGNIPVGQARFLDLGNGTIFDRATRLMWIKQPDLIIPGGPVGAVNQILVAHGVWATAHGYIVGDLVQGDGAPDALFYVCIADHTSDGGNEPPVDAGTCWVETIWTASSVAFPLTPAIMDFTTAIAACEALDTCGFSDWRMPNILELVSLVDFEQAGVPTINGTAFPNTQSPSPYYSSSTTRAAATINHEYVQFNGMGIVNWGAKADGRFIRPVRGGIING